MKHTLPVNKNTLHNIEQGAGWFARAFRKVGSALLVLLMAVAALPAGAQNELPASQQPEISYTADHPSYVLGGITIEGGENFDEQLLKSISGLTIGQTYEVPGAEISEAVRRYWRQKMFSNVSITADSIVAGKIYLRIKLTAQPRIASINYSGVKKSEREDLEARLGLKTGSNITPDIVDRAKTIIKRYFEEKGFKNATVDIIQREDVTGENRVLLDIVIDKNEKIKVHRIHISGTDEKYVGKLKRAMKKTREKSLVNIFKSKKFLPEKYEEDKGFLIERLNEWGYRDALLLSDSVVSVGPSEVDIYLNLYQGQKYYIRNIEWVGNTVYNSEALSRVLKMKKGDVYNQTLLQERLEVDDDAIGNQYYDNGYVFYRLDPVEVNIVNDSIDLEMRISEGRQATLNRIRISGNDRVYEDVIRRELRTKPGDLFSMDAIKRSIRELSSMNQFDPEALQRDLQIKPDEASGTVNIDYGLVTKGADQIELSAGWGQTGIVGRIGLKFTNFSMQNLFGKGNKRAGFIPQGDGQTLSISGQTNGTYFQSYSISFLDPWFGKKRPNQLSVSLYYSKQSDVNSNYYGSDYYNSLYSNIYGYGNSSSYYNYTNYYDPDKYVKMFGLSIGFGKRLRWPDDYFTFMAELAYTRYMLKSWQYFLITDGNCNNINLSLTLNRTSTNQTFFPSRGSEFSFSVSATPPYSLWDGKDYKNLANNYQSSSYQAEAQEKYRWIEYHKWKVKFRSFTALTGKVKCPVLMTRAEVGLLGAYNRHKKSPFETFYVGGDGMSGYSTGYATETIGLRGYDNGALAGANGDNGYAYTRLTLELRYPLMLETSTSMYALAFVEAGNAWTDINKFNPFDLKRSAGLGVRIFLPMVGLMGIDWAYGFQKTINGQKVGGSQFHFIIGQEF